jgi:hypothetical protein
MALAEKQLQKPAPSGLQDEDQFDERMREAFREAIREGVIPPVPDSKKQSR